MKNFLNPVFFFILLVSLPGCGHSKKDPIPDEIDSDLVTRIQAGSFAKAKEIARNANPSCKLVRCEPALGLLTSASQGGGAAMCTSFLIQPDVIATNSHCIPEDLKKPGASCADRIWVTFPASRGNDFEQKECEEILDASDLHGGSELNPDFAFFRLKTPSSRPPLPPSREGFPGDQPIHAIKFTPYKDPGGKPSATLEEIKCETIQRSLKLKSFNHPQRAVVSVSGCQLVHGNSGSPILNASHQVIGIAQAYMHNEGLSTVGLRSKGLLLTENLKQVELATSFACIQESWLALAPPAPEGICFPPADAKNDSEANDFKASVLPALHKKFSAGIDSWKSTEEGSNEAIRAFEWQLLETSPEVARTLGVPVVQHEHFVHAIPKCIRDLNVFLASVRKGKSISDGKFYLQFRAPFWKYRLGYNAYLQADSTEPDDYAHVGFILKGDFPSNSSADQAKWTLEVLGTYSGLATYAPIPNLTLEACQP